MRRDGLAIAICVASSVVLQGCRTGTDAERPAIAAVTGRVTLGVQLSSGVVLSRVDYVVTGNGIAPISGSIALVDPQSVSSAEIGLPAGTGYRVVMTAAQSQTTCRGESLFDVVANAKSAVTLRLFCETPPKLGAARVGGQLDVCPQVTAYVAAPVEVAVGSQIGLNVTAEDADGDPITYTWSGGAGTFANISAPQTTFTCGAEGTSALHIAVSDGDCGEQVTILVTCVPFCQANPDGSACDDHNACTRLDRCQASVCVGTDPVPCTPFDQCHSPGLCDSQTGLCSNPPAVDGTACSDGSACTLSDSCVSGICVGGNPVLCTAADVCHMAGVCDPASASCSNPQAPNGTTCPLPNAVAACATGACAVSSCLGPFGDCDGLPTNGCETSLSGSVANCGACAHVCIGGQTCQGGLCFSPPPIGVQAVPGGWSIRVSWNASPGATGYEVRRATSGAGPYSAIGMTPTAEWLDESVATGTTYFYAIASQSPGGTSAPSTSASAQPLTKQICITDVNGAALAAFDATQSGSATPVRTLSYANAPDPEAVVLDPKNQVLLFAQAGGAIGMFDATASGNAAPLLTLTGATPGADYFAIALDESRNELFTADYGAGKVYVLNSRSGSLKRTLTGGLGSPSSIALDLTHEELFVGGTDPTGTFQRIQVFNRTDSGAATPIRTLGASSNPTVGGWSVVYDPVHDELLTSCGCNGKVTAFGRMATGNAAPLRTMQASNLSTVFAMLLDPGTDTVWISGEGVSPMLAEFPRSGNGTVSPLHPAIRPSGTGFVAKCN